MWQGEVHAYSSHRRGLKFFQKSQGTTPLEGIKLKGIKLRHEYLMIYKIDQIQRIKSRT
jgi:hypothetical protein